MLEIHCEPIGSLGSKNFIWLEVVRSFNFCSSVDWLVKNRCMSSTVVTLEPSPCSLLYCDAFSSASSLRPCMIACPFFLSSSRPPLKTLSVWRMKLSTVFSAGLVVVDLLNTWCNTGVVKPFSKKLQTMVDISRDKLLNSPPPLSDTHAFKNARPTFVEDWFPPERGLFLPPDLFERFLLLARPPEKPVLVPVVLPTLNCVSDVSVEVKTD